MLSIIDALIQLPHFAIFVFLSAAMERAIHKKQTDIEGWNILVGVWLFFAGVCTLLPVRFWGETALPSAFLVVAILYLYVSWYVRDNLAEANRLATP